MITEAISAKLLDEILSTFFEKIKNAGVTSYGKLTNPIELNFPQEDVNKIIREAFENARKCNCL
jgi:hypothetical protein